MEIQSDRQIEYTIQNVYIFISVRATSIKSILGHRRQQKKKLITR
jgi:hypothetical protein